MKKIFLAALVAASTLTANAQQEAGSLTLTPRVGVGYTFTDIHVVDALNDVKVTGSTTASLGAQLRYQIAEKLGISAGLDFTYMETGEVNDCKFTTSLIEVPVLLHYDITSKFGLFAGAKFNFLSDVKFETPKQDIKLTDDCEKTTVSFPVGLQINFNSPWTLSAYYNIATSPIVKKEKSGFEKDLDLSSIMVTIGYRFDL